MSEIVLDRRYFLATAGALLVEACSPIATKPATPAESPVSDQIKSIFAGYGNNMFVNSTGASGVKEYLNQPHGSGEFTHFVKASTLSRTNNILTLRLPFPVDKPYIAFQSLLTYTANDSGLLISLLVGDFAHKTSEGLQQLICNFDTNQPIILTATYHNFHPDRILKFNGQSYDTNAPSC